MTLVEFTGCAGSGKTTLAENVLMQLSRRGHDVNLLRVGGGGMSDWMAARHFLSFASRERGLSRFLLGTIVRDADTWIDRPKLIRNVAKKLGAYHQLVRGDASGIVVWDEGTVHLAQNVFVHGSRRFRPEELRRFAAEVPLPTVLVYVRAPADVIERRLERRQSRFLERSVRFGRPFVENSQRALDLLVSNPRISGRVVLVDNDSDDLDSVHATAGRVTDAILERLALRIEEARDW